MSAVTKLAVGVDIGGTNTVFGLVDRQGTIHAEGSICTEGHQDVDRFIEALHSAIAAACAALPFDYHVSGVGVGAPNANYYTGTIENAANLPWRGEIAFAHKVQQYFPGVPVILTNDAKAAALGEMAYGGARGMRNFVVITLGTGLGSGFVANGQIIYGHDSYAGELGHAIIVEGGRSCGCGRAGCLETYASASGIVRTAFEVMACMKQDSSLRNVSFNEMNPRMISEAAEKGDPIALETFERTGKMLGLALANAVTITSPEAIFLFGGVTRAGKYLTEPTKRYMEANLLSNYSNKIEILPSMLMDKNAAVLGASSLVWARIEL